MAAAILFNGDDILMMKRSPTRKLAPGMWAAIGGHLEIGEHSTPMSGCLREIYEETQLEESDITDLRLRYIILRLKDDEIRHQYIYVGNTAARQVHQTDEGDLHWIHRAKILNLEMTATTRFIFEHYFTIGEADCELRVGTVSAFKRKANITWATLQDWESPTM
jgi:8-oxo-dGTP diphosphatase